MSKADEYRKFATECLEVAQRMSLRDDRNRMTGMAQKWLELAQTAEAREARQATPPHRRPEGITTPESVN
jgi:hypothetical protein